MSLLPGLLQLRHTWVATPHLAVAGEEGLRSRLGVNDGQALMPDAMPSLLRDRHDLVPRPVGPTMAQPRRLARGRGGGVESVCCRVLGFFQGDEYVATAGAT